MKPDYVYLGVTFNYDGSFKKAIEKQITQARKAMYALLQKAKILRLPFDIIFELYEQCVIPVLLYGSEVWGFENLASVEIFHRKFFKLVLKTFIFTLFLIGSKKFCLPQLQLYVWNYVCK